MDVASELPPNTRFLLELELARRSAQPRSRTAAEFVKHFFPHDEQRAEDRVFRHLPPDVRGPILAGWGLRGLKAALRDSDAKVESLVHEALLAGDLDAERFEESLTPDLLVRHVPSPQVASFVRQVPHTAPSIARILGRAHAASLFDAAWFFAHVTARGGKITGLDAVCDLLSKQEIVEWLKRVHASGDGSPRSWIAALDLELTLAKLPLESLASLLEGLVDTLGSLDGPDQAVGSKTLTPGVDEGGGPPVCAIPAAAKVPGEEVQATAKGAPTEAATLPVGEAPISPPPPPPESPGAARSALVEEPLPAPSAAVTPREVRVPRLADLPRPRMTLDLPRPAARPGPQAVQSPARVLGWESEIHEAPAASRRIAVDRESSPVAARADRPHPPAARTALPTPHAPGTDEEMPLSLSEEELIVAIDDE